MVSGGIYTGHITMFRGDHGWVGIGNRKANGCFWRLADIRSEQLNETNLRVGQPVKFWVTAEGSGPHAGRLRAERIIVADRGQQPPGRVTSFPDPTDLGSRGWRRV
jgi:hypothetical protein